MTLQGATGPERVKFCELLGFYVSIKFLRYLVFCEFFAFHNFHRSSVPYLLGFSTYLRFRENLQFCELFGFLQFLGFPKFRELLAFCEFLEFNKLHQFLGFYEFREFFWLTRVPWTSWALRISTFSLHYRRQFNFSICSLSVPYIHLIIIVDLVQNTINRREMRSAQVYNFLYSKSAKVFYHVI